MTKAPIPELPTQVGHAARGDNLYRGHSVATQLAGKRGLWNTISLSIGGPRLEPHDVKVLDAITTSSLAADPRIWPMKLTRLASAYGQVTTGMSVGMMGIARAPIGSRPVADMARFLVDLSTRLEQGSSLADEVARVCEERRHFPGFGVPSRGHDERVVALHGCLTDLGRGGGHYWKLVEDIRGLLSKERALPVNLAAAMASALLDLKFTAEQIFLMATMVLLPNFFANAFEGAQQSPAILQRLPDHVVQYVGAAPRPSPRAETHARHQAPDE